MTASGKIQITIWSLGLAGAGLFTVLLIRQGAPQVGAAFVSAGWAISAVVIYHLAVPLFLDAIAWWLLFPNSVRLSLWQLFWMRWIGESVSTLVPSAAVGGDVVRARLAALHGAPVPTAAASVLEVACRNSPICLRLINPTPTRILVSQSETVSMLVFGSKGAPRPLVLLNLGTANKKPIKAPSAMHIIAHR